MKDKKFLALSSLFFLLFFAMIGFASLDQPISGILRAKNSTMSPLKSFAVVFPQMGVAGQENSETPATKVKISVYIRDVTGESMPGRSVKLAADAAGVNIVPADSQNTDELGMAQFFLTSTSPGKIKLTATDLTSGTPIANIPTVEFTQ